MTVYDTLFNDSAYFTGPPISEDMIINTEKILGYRLPMSYIHLLRIKNGGSLNIQCYPTNKSTPWGEDHLVIAGIYGIAGKLGIDTRFGSRHLIAEWGYPDIGIVIAGTPSSGHDAIMLDYSLCGLNGEPQIIYVNTETEVNELEVIVLADNFEIFIHKLVPCGNYNR